MLTVITCRDLPLTDFLRIGLPALFALLPWLSYTNFKHLTVGWRLWLENASVLFVVVFVVCELVVLFAHRLDVPIYRLPEHSSMLDPSLRLRPCPNPPQNIDLSAASTKGRSRATLPRDGE